MSDSNDYNFHSTEAIFQQGLDLLESDHFEEALDAFDFVVREQPFNVDALFHRGVVLVNLGRLDEAVRTFHSALDLAPTEASFHSHVAFALMLKGDHDEALSHFDTALELQPDSHANKVYKACLLAERKQLGEARQILEEVVEEHPDDPEPRRHLATVLTAIGEFQEALVHYNAILKQDPNHTEALLKRAVILGQVGQPEAAIRGLREYLALQPEDLSAWLTLIDALLQDNRLEAAVATAGAAIEAGHESAIVYQMRGRALLELNRLDAAITDLRRARTLEERDSETHFLLAKAFMARGRVKHALLSVNRCLQLFSGDRRALALKATIHHSLGEYEEEVEILGRLLEETPADWRLARLRVDALLARNETHAAAAALDQFLNHQPNHRRALLMSAQLHERLHDYDSARKRYVSLVRHAPVGPRAYASYGAFLVRQGDLNAALDLLNTACSDHPDDAPLHALRAVVLQSMGAHLETVAVLAPICQPESVAPAELHWLLGRSMYALQDFELALVQFQAARRKGSGPAHAASPEAAAPTFRCLIAEAYTLHHLKRTAEGIRLLERNLGHFRNSEREYIEALGDLYELSGGHAKALSIFSDGVRHFPSVAMFHYRLARAQAMQGRRADAIESLAAAFQLDPELAKGCEQEACFRTLTWLPSFNRLVSWRPWIQRGRLSFFAALWISAVVGASFLLRGI